MTDTTFSMQGLTNFMSPLNSLEIVRQSENTECGLACLAMVSGYFGCHHSLSQLRGQFGVDNAGMNASHLMQIASEMGMIADLGQIDTDGYATYTDAVIDAFNGMTEPVVLHWDGEHFVVLKSLKKTRQLNPLKPNFMKSAWIATVYDPARGIQEYGIQEFVSHFHTGYLFTFKLATTFKAGDNRERLSLSNLWSQIRGLKTSISLILTLSIVLQFTQMITPYYVQTILDSVFITSDHDLLSVLAIGFTGLVIFERIAGMVRGVSLNIFNNIFNSQLSTGLYRHLLRLPQQFFENRAVGDILSRFSSLEQIRNVMVSGLILAVLDGLMSVMIFTLMMFYSVKLTLIIIGMISVYLLLQWVFMSKSKEYTERIIEKEADIHSQQIETLRAMATIKLFNAQFIREEKWGVSMNSFLKLSVAHGNFKEMMLQISSLIKGLSNVLIVYLGALMVMDGSFSAGMFLAFLAYRTMLADSLSNLISKYAEYRLLDVHLDRVSDVVLSEVENGGDAPSPNDQILTGTIELKNVDFHYGSGAAKKKILSDVSMTIQSGEFVAITGPSGAGKTTLMKVMLGSLTPSSGDVLVDGVALSSFGLRKFRNQIATVMQEDQLLSGSILENITFFADDIDREWAMECAKAASIFDDIEAMPMGWNTLVGDMGSMLSGGQKQRILLARALYRRPRIIFLDEATSHLDKEREANINNAMAKMSITRIIIAHRQETIDSADRIIRIGS